MLTTKKTNKINVIALIALAAVGSAAPSAHADEHQRHGALCAAKHTSTTLVGADERGIYNASTTAAARVFCPVSDRTTFSLSTYDAQANHSQSEHVTYDLASVTVHARDLSTTLPFSCYLFWTQDMGFSSWAPTRYMCSDPDGCADSTSEYTGMASITWSFPLYPQTIPDRDAVGVSCNLPPTSSLGSSYVKSVRSTDRRTFTIFNYVFDIAGGDYLFSVSQFRGN